jgi:hypothetical protein
MQATQNKQLTDISVIMRVCYMAVCAYVTAWKAGDNPLGRVLSIDNNSYRSVRSRLFHIPKFFRNFGNNLGWALLRIRGDLRGFCG